MQRGVNAGRRENILDKRHNTIGCCLLIRSCMYVCKGVVFTKNPSKGHKSRQKVPYHKNSFQRYQLEHKVGFRSKRHIEVEIVALM